VPPGATELESVHEVTKNELCDMGWILQELEGGGSRFLERVKVNPTKRFDIR